jgi:4-aminobutyrate aminotransferase-like enzyme
MADHPPRLPDEEISNEARRIIAEKEPAAQRASTPVRLVIAKSAGVFHWTPEGRKLYDYTSGTLVANLGHNHAEWHRALMKYMGWNVTPSDEESFPATPLTATHAVTGIEAQAVRRLLANLHSKPGGKRLEQILWATTGTDAVHKALRAALAFDPRRDVILATRGGFHGHRGLAEAVSGDDNSPNRDPRVRFISFPREECLDITMRDSAFDPAPYRAEIEDVASTLVERQIACLITEPYLGASGSYHPPRAYLQALQEFCRKNRILFILDEAQSNFGRTGQMYALRTYGIEPDILVLGNGLGNGIPVSCAVGRSEVLGALGPGQGADTFSANPLACAAVLATLDVFEGRNVLKYTRRASDVVEEGLLKLKEIPFVKHVRGELGGMIWGLEIGEFGGKPPTEVAYSCVAAAYRGDEKGRAVHLAAPLAGKMIRIAPPLVITEEEARESTEALYDCFKGLEKELSSPAS